MARLKADCAAASKDGDFYACPGIEFTDGVGNRWAFWGEKIVWPDASFLERQSSRMSSGTASASITTASTSVPAIIPAAHCWTTSSCAQNGAHRENLWWFYHYLPLVYEKDRLIADNESEYLFGLRDMRMGGRGVVHAHPNSRRRGRRRGRVFHRHEGSAVGQGRAQYDGLPPIGPRPQAGQYASQGPVIAAWQAMNSQMESNWRYTRGAQRVRLRFVVRSDAGIAEVKVLDADRGPIRRFLGHGAKELSREFELVHDQQHYLTLEVMDTAGKKAISHEIMVYCYKAGLFRCGDNLNILGPTAMCWHPDRNQFFNAAKDFRNGSDYCLRGWDTASATLGVPTPAGPVVGHDQPQGEPADGIPTIRLGAMVGRLMDVGVNSYNLQIATMRMTKLSESFDTEKRPTPSFASIARDVGDLEYFDRTHTLYAPMERVDMFVAWNYRRDREGRKDYRGGILWHEGEIRFKKDCTLQGAVPIPLFWDRCPTDLTKNIGTTFIVTDADGSTRVGMVRDEKKPVHASGPHPAGRLRRLDDHAGGLSRPAGPGGHGFRLPGVTALLELD